jgi:hypothetical protein
MQAVTRNYYSQSRVNLPQYEGLEPTAAAIIETEPPRAHRFVLCFPMMLLVRLVLW